MTEVETKVEIKSDPESQNEKGEANGAVKIKVEIKGDPESQNDNGEANGAVKADVETKVEIKSDPESQNDNGEANGAVKADVETKVEIKSDPKSQNENGAANSAIKADVETKVEIKSETESDKENGATNDAVKAEVDVHAKVLRQIEYYFGDFNLPKDKFLKETIAGSDGGWVDLDIMLKFQRLAHITTDKRVILESLKNAELVEVDTEKQAIRRNPELPVPEFNESLREEHVAKTVYVKGFEKEKTTLSDLIDFFKSFDGVANVVKRTYTDKKKNNERFFKGSSFVTFKTKGDAEKFLAIESVKNPEGEELIRKWQKDYFEEKNKEFEEKRRNRKSEREQAKRAKAVLEKASGDVKVKEEEDEEEATDLPKGSVLCMDGFTKEDTKREDIRDKLIEMYEIKREDIAFMYFQKGEKDAKIRFKEENAAVELFKKITGTEVVVNEDKLNVTVLEGDAETEFLKQCQADLAKKRKDSGKKGHKRKAGNRDGYRGGSKRQRR